MRYVAFFCAHCLLSGLTVFWVPALAVGIMDSGATTPLWFVVMANVEIGLSFPLIYPFLNAGLLFWYEPSWGVLALISLALVNSTLVTLAVRVAVQAVSSLLKKTRRASV